MSQKIALSFTDSLTGENYNSVIDATFSVDALCVALTEYVQNMFDPENGGEETVENVTCTIERNVATFVANVNCFHTTFLTGAKYLVFSGTATLL